MQTDQLQDTSLKTFRCSQIARRRILFIYIYIYIYIYICILTYDARKLKHKILFFFNWHKRSQASFSKMPFHYVLQHLFVVRYTSGIRNNMEIWLPLQTRKVVWELAFLLTQADTSRPNASATLHNIMFCFLRIRNIPNHVRFVTSRQLLGQFSRVLRISSTSIIPAMRQTNHLLFIVAPCILI